MAALITVDELKTYLKVEDTTKDAFYTEVINSVSAAIDSYLHRQIAKTDFTKIYDGDGSGKLDLGVRNIINITSIEIDGVLVDSSYYAVFTDIGIIKMLTGEYSTRLRASSMVFPYGIQNIKVIFSAGYDPVPDDVKHACKMLCSYFLNRRGKEDKTSVSDTANNTATSFIAKIPADIKMLLNRYKNFKVNAI